MNDHDLNFPEAIRTLKYAQQYTAQILAWTNGQPELTERLCQMILSDSLPETPDAIPQYVNEVVCQYLENDLYDTENPDNAKVLTLLERITVTLLNSEASESLLTCYQKVLLSPQPQPFLDTVSENRLRQVGLLQVTPQRDITVSNLMLKKAFNLDWTTQALAQKQAKQTLDKYHLALIGGLISALIFGSAWGLSRYSPYVRLLNCNGREEFKRAVDANVALNAAQIETSIRELSQLNQTQSIPEVCTSILYDLQYSQAIYISAGTYNNPLAAVKTLCEIPAQYFAERLTKPWITRWVNLYQSTTFPQDVSTFLQANPCPGASVLSRS